MQLIHQSQMPPKRDPVPRARSALQWLTGLLMLGVIAAAVIAAGMRLWQDIDIQRLTRTPGLADPVAIPTALPPASASVVSRTFPAALYYSHESAAFFPDPDYYPGILDGWEELIGAVGGQVVRISDPDQIDSLTADHVLVAPTALCMTDRVITALRSHAERGGGLVINWAVGARDSDCEWLGWDAVTRLTAAVEIRELEKREALFYSIPAGLPLSLGFDPGTRVELRFESQLAAATPGTRVYWADWAMNAAPAEDTDDVNAAVLTHVTEAGGRVAWFGFRMGQGATPDDEERNLRLFSNGVTWAAGLPAAEIATWPQAARATLLIAEDVESRFSNAVALANIARHKAVPVTFFVVSQLALEHPDIADSLSAAGEVGSQTSDHSVIAGLTYSDQRSRLSRSWTEIHRWAGDSAFGLHPPEERFDENTLRAWRSLGGRYVVAVNDARTASPEVYDTPDGKIVLLPRIIKDDYNVFVQEGALRSRHLTQAYLQGMAKVRAVGGLAVVSLRTQVAGEPGRVGVVGAVIDSAQSKGEWWIATGRSVADWWLARRETKVQISDLPGGDLELRVTTSPQHGLLDGWLNLILPGDPQFWTPEMSGQPLQYSETNWGLRIPIPDMAPSEESVIVLRHNGATET